MRPLTNFHAHSTFCDGAETPEAMVQAAIAKGCEAFGISGHAYMGFETCWTMTKTGEVAFASEMTRLKKQYASALTLFTGVEQDYYSVTPTGLYDYKIGSVHFIQKEGVLLLVDESGDVQQDDVTKYYSGDFYAYTRDYYRTVADIVQKTKPDIVGHFDLITKFNEGGVLFDETDKRYLNPALEALAAITETHKLFEINTGAMYRVGKTNPYPAPALLKALCERGGEIILSSDSHDGASIGYQFDAAAELAKSCGFRYAKTLTTDGFKEYIL